MLKILFKSVILVFIILSIYFIVNPAACSNLMMGRVTNSTDMEPTLQNNSSMHGEMFVPAGDQPLETAPAAYPASAEPTAAATARIADMLDEPAPAPVPAYSQEDIDYAVASRYVELENEYARQNKTGKDVAKEISYTVMDDFELTQPEWEAFLQRATQTNLFNKVRSDMKVQ